MLLATRKSYWLLYSPILLFALVFPGDRSQLFAQATANLRGSVVDSSGAVIPDVTVNATNTATSVPRVATTNQDGIYVFPDLPIGSYSVKATHDGFETQQQNDVELLTGRTIELRFVLPVGSATQSVEVTSDAPLIQTSSSSVQASVDQKQIQDLPLNGRNALQLTTLTPGTALTNVGTESGQQCLPCRGTGWLYVRVGP